MKIIYYVTGLGLGHATRTVAIVRELVEQHATVTIRNNDPISFFKQSLPNTRIVSGQTDFIPVMKKSNAMMIDNKKTRQTIVRWIRNLPEVIEKESSFIEKEKPDLVISDISIMPILVAHRNDIRSVAISNFIWSETLEMDKESLNFFTNAYCKADLIIKLPLGSMIKLPNKVESGLIARKITEQKSTVRRQLDIPEDKKLVTIALSALEQISFHKSNEVEMLDISDYTTILKAKKKVNFVEGQNIINASDLLICKCGYGFLSECLAYGTKFRYLLEPTHKEARGIHVDLERIGLKNRISLEELRKQEIDNSFIERTPSFRMKTNNKEIANRILNVL